MSQHLFTLHNVYTGDSYPLLHCNLCGEDVRGRMTAVWHAKRHGADVQIISGKSIEIVESRYEIVSMSSGHAPKSGGNDGDS